LTASLLKATFNFKMYVCLCKGVTDRQIKDLASQGVRCVTEVGRCSGAGTRCGSCRSTISKILESEPASATPAQRHDASQSAA
jgi:bacterioferritin-associated ferredoxin